MPNFLEFRTTRDFLEISLWGNPTRYFEGAIGLMYGYLDHQTRRWQLEDPEEAEHLIKNAFNALKSEDISIIPQVATIALSIRQAQRFILRGFIELEKHLVPLLGVSFDVESVEIPEVFIAFDGNIEGPFTVRVQKFATNFDVKFLNYDGRTLCTA